MMAAERPQGLLARLPAIRGRLAAAAPLAGITWFGVGGAAEAMARPVDVEDLATLLAGAEPGLPVTVIGVASNLLVRDGGIPGLVVRLGRGFAGIAVDGDRLTVGAAALDANVAAVAADAGLGGLEFLSGVPGTIGGALRMNAGAYGGDMSQVVASATALDRQGGLHRLGPAELGFSYRHSAVPADWVFVEAELRGTPGDPAAIRQRLADIRSRREATQPIRTRTGGSTFRNPPGAPGGAKAWELIDQAGCRGLLRGGAQVSALHTNFLINVGGATAADLEDLGEDVRRRVLETSGVELHWEIARVGRR